MHQGEDGGKLILRWTFETFEGYPRVTRCFSIPGLLDLMQRVGYFSRWRRNCHQLVYSLLAIPQGAQDIYKVRFSLFVSFPHVILSRPVFFLRLCSIAYRQNVKPGWNVRWSLRASVHPSCSAPRDISAVIVLHAHFPALRRGTSLVKRVRIHLFFQVKMEKIELAETFWQPTTLKGFFKISLCIVPNPNLAWPIGTGEEGLRKANPNHVNQRAWNFMQSSVNTDNITSCLKEKSNRAHTNSC
jgi:hypothetical protein